MKQRWIIRPKLRYVLRAALCRLYLKLGLPNRFIPLRWLFVGGFAEILFDHKQLRRNIKAERTGDKTTAEAPYTLNLGHTPDVFFLKSSADVATER